MRTRQAGHAAIELALTMAASLIVLPVLLFFGRAFWQYNAMQKAAYQAARFMAAVPAAQIVDPIAAPAARAVAQQMLIDASDAVGLDVALTSTGIEVRCDGTECVGGGVAKPQRIEVTARLYVNGFGFDVDSGTLAPDVSSQLSIAVSANLAYLN